MDSHEHSESCAHTPGSTRNRFYLSALILVLIAVFGYFSYAKKAEVAKQEQAAVTTEPIVTASETTAPTYQDGTYSAVGNYTSPAGPEQLGVSLTLANNIITAAEVTPKAVKPMSKKFQGEFVANFLPLVIGKKIDEMMLTKVSGSSLAPKGFNDALEQIKTQARS